MLRRNLHRKKVKRSFACVTCAVFLAAFGVASHAAVEPTNPPVTPREFYNDGTRKLREGKWHEAETSLQVAVASQNDKVQTAALYNLGEVRFRQGQQELSNAPPGNDLSAKSQHAEQTGAAAIHAADDALAGDDLQALIAAYQHGRGAQKELKGA